MHKNINYEKRKYHWHNHTHFVGVYRLYHNMKSITKRLLKKKSIPRDTDTSSNTIDVVAFENTEINEDAPKDDDTSSSEVVFEYTGNEHVPKEVTHVQFHPKVTDTNANAFIELLN